MVKWKVAPWPDLLSTQMRPFMSFTSPWQMTSPNPVPPNSRAMVLSAWLKD
jgi:hypothetical protein